MSVQALFHRKMFFKTLVIIGLTTILSACDKPIPKVDVATIIENFSKSIPELTAFVTALAYVLGLFFVLKGITGLKHLGESRTMMSREHSMTGPLIYIFVGAALLYIPTTIKVGIATFWATSAPYAYVTGHEDEWTKLLDAAYLIIQLIGVIAVIRGLILLTHLGGHGGERGTFARAMTHIVGGIFCINIYQFIDTIINTVT